MKPPTRPLCSPPRTADASFTIRPAAARFTPRSATTRCRSPAAVSARQRHRPARRVGDAVALLPDGGCAHQRRWNDELAHRSAEREGAIDRESPTWRFPPPGEYVGLDARTALPPLLRPGMLMDWESWWMIEAATVDVLLTSSGPVRRSAWTRAARRSAAASVDARRRSARVARQRGVCRRLVIDARDRRERSWTWRLRAIPADIARRLHDGPPRSPRPAPRHAGSWPRTPSRTGRSISATGSGRGGARSKRPPRCSRPAQASATRI